MFDIIVSDTWQYLELFNFVDLCEIELLEIELFDHLCVNKWLMFNSIVNDR